MWGLVAVAVPLIALVWQVRRTHLRVRIVGHSMAPGLLDGTQVFTKRISPERLLPGDIVVLPEPGTGQLIIKRIAALAGEPFPFPRDGELQVPPGMVAVLGDNPTQSNDSRHFGYVPAERIRGRLVRVVPRPGQSR